MSKAKWKQGKKGVPITSLKYSLEETLDLVKGNYSMELLDNYSYDSGLIKGSMNIGERYILQIVRLAEGCGYAKNPFADRKYKSVKILGAVDKGRLHLVEVDGFDDASGCVVARVVESDEPVTLLPLKFYNPHLLKMYDSTLNGPVGGTDL